MLKYEAYALTDIGNVRTNNEDNFFCNGIYKKDVSMPVYIFDEKGDAGKLSVFAVFDGMGGADCGETASLTAAENLGKYFEEITAKERIFSGEEAILYMNAALCIEMEKKQANMGSTAVVLSIQAGFVQIANVGDSRAYLYRDVNARRNTRRWNTRDERCTYTAFRCFRRRFFVGTIYIRHVKPVCRRYILVMQ